MLPSDIDNWFTYHPPAAAQAAKYVSIREAGKILAATIYVSCPRGADRDAAIMKVREAVMIANASIACGGE